MDGYRNLWYLSSQSCSIRFACSGDLRCPQSWRSGDTVTLPLLGPTDFQPKGLESVVCSVEPLPVPKRDVLCVDVHPIIERLVDRGSHDQPPLLTGRGISAGAFDRNLAVGVIGATIHHEAPLP